MTRFSSKLSREDLLNWHQPFWSQSLLIHRPFERNENAKMRLVVFNAYFNDDQPNPALTPDEILFAKHMLVIESLPTHLQERSDESTKQDRVPFHEIDPPIFNFTAYR